MYVWAFFIHGNLGYFIFNERASLKFKNDYDFIVKPAFRLFPIVVSDSLPNHTSFTLSWTGNV